MDKQNTAPMQFIIGARKFVLRAATGINAHDPVAAVEARRILALDLGAAPALPQNLQYDDKPMQAVKQDGIEYVAIGRGRIKIYRRDMFGSD